MSDGGAEQIEVAGVGVAQLDDNWRNGILTIGCVLLLALPAYAVKKLVMDEDQPRAKSAKSRKTAEKAEQRLEEKRRIADSKPQKRK